MIDEKRSNHFADDTISITDNVNLTVSGKTKEKNIFSSQMTFFMEVKNTVIANSLTRCYTLLRLVDLKKHINFLSNNLYTF